MPASSAANLTRPFRVVASRWNPDVAATLLLRATLPRNINTGTYNNLVIRPGFLGIWARLEGLIAELDWSRTSLGPIEAWPEVVKTTVALILQSPVPIVTLLGR